MILKNKHDRQKYFDVAQRSSDVLRELYEKTSIGVTPVEVEELAQQLLKKMKAGASFASARNAFGRYGHATCISVNDEALHGLPTSTRPFQSGDVIAVDFGLILDGWYTDQCFSVGLGDVSPRHRQLLNIGKDAVLAGVAQARAGNTTGDVGHAMEETARTEQFDTLKQYIGHGIGHQLHESPEVPAWGKPGSGSELVAGTVITVEAQVVTGSTEVITDPENGWTIRTKDGGYSVMFEYMVMVDEKAPKIMTPTSEWPVLK
jgi:methionyl aminopeptidase